MSASKQALQLTTAAIDRRAFHFRNLVVTVVLVVLGCLVAAAVQWSWRPLVGWFFLAPLCGVFLMVDNYIVSRWQTQLLAMWAEGELHVEEFAQSILSLRLLPGATLRGMLALLPASGDGPPIDRLPRPAREFVARLYSSFHQGARDYSAAFTVAYTVSVACAGWALVTWDWRPLWGCLAIVVAFVAARAMNALRLRRCREIIRDARKKGFDLQELAGSLAYGPGQFD